MILSHEIVTSCTGTKSNCVHALCRFEPAFLPRVSVPYTLTDFKMYKAAVNKAPGVAVVSAVQTFPAPCLTQFMTVDWTGQTA